MHDTRLEVVNLAGGLEDAGRAYGERFSPWIVGFCRAELRPDRRRLGFARRCRPSLEQYAPQAAAFLHGMAQGAGLSDDHAVLLSLHEEIFHQKHPHCTALAAAGKATGGRSAFVGMNWDWSPALYPWPGFIRLAAAKLPRVLAYHYPGLFTCAGINEHGLGFMWTGAGYLPRVAPKVGVPTYAIIAELLWRRDVNQALAYLREVPNAGAYIFFLADASGQMAVVEALPGQAVIDQSHPALSRANHYECPLTVRCSRQVRRFPPGTSTGPRSKRMAALLQQHYGSLTPEIGKAILLDRHGPGPWIHQYPCGRKAHELAGMTIDSLLAVCPERLLWTCRGGATPGPWQALTV